MRFLVIVRGNPEVIARALIDPHATEHVEHFEPAAS
jgi:hypothetical protein